MDASLATIRRFLIEYFSDEDLTQLCFDHFHEVYRNLATDMTIGRKALQLVDYCYRRDLLPKLLGVLEQERPDSFSRVFGVRPDGRDRGVNINTAEIDELRNLPGIGPVLAGAIRDGRPFTSVDDLSRVPGIGPRRLAAVRHRCVV
jgi:DNA uptake protein ComE-like DNA-binding protein